VTAAVLHGVLVQRDVVIRPFVPSDEESWLRCRVLSFLHTGFFDDVVTEKPDRDAPVQLVAVGLVGDGTAEVRGLLDVTVDGVEATLENVAVHPDHQSTGIGTALLSAALRACTSLGVQTLTAWTREDPSTLRWYEARGFEETFRYLHVYGSFYRDDLPAGLAPLVLGHTGTDLVGVFLHAPIEREAEMRAAHRRVYIDRSYVLAVPADPL
jgi:GNAT superfamily N-acetyltransferase